MDKNDHEIQFLMMEYRNVVGAINRTLDSRGRAISFGVTIVTASLVLAPAEYRRHAFVLLPCALIGLLLYYIQSIRETCLLRGYRKWLEERINQHANKPALLWESSLYGLMGGAAVDKFGFLNMVQAVAVVLSVVLAVYTTFAETHSRGFRLFAYSMLCLSVFLSLALLLTWLKTKAAFGRAYSTCSNSGPRSQC
jgi:hypothetical protein